MPRVAEARLPAEPSSAGQRRRHLRILQAAAELAAEQEFDRVQMQEVARRAEVAIGTLYRYFPSKIHLFVAVMAEEVDNMAEHADEWASSGDPVKGVLGLLSATNEALLTRPALASAMVASASTANAEVVDVTRIDRTFQSVLTRAAGIDEPTEHQATVIRLVLQLWYSLLQASLTGRRDWQEAMHDLEIGIRLLMAPVA